MSRGKINLIIGVHCHQPVDNFDHVVNRAYGEGYFPFIKVLETHPEIKVVLHYSGSLYEWILEHRSEFFDHLKDLHQRGQIEIMGGGFYEPILPLIPDEDKIGQIEMLSDFIQERFSCRVRGAWLGERVWEPDLPRIFARTGIQYTVVDDGHVRAAGTNAGEDFGYYVTEEEGEELFLFVTSQKMRYMVPFAGPERVIDYLNTLANGDGDKVVVIADDGERFGVWPGTHKIVYEDDWLEKFFTLLETNRDWIQVTTFSEFIDTYPPGGRIYLPSGAYPEMMEWSGGNFRNFLLKYPESNNMHKKMLEVSDRLSSLRKREKGESAEGKHSSESFDGDGLFLEARRELYRGQCNCAYWHGVFGGLYLSHLRASIYRHLIASEKLLDEIEKKDSEVTLTTADFDRDGRNELIINSRELKLYLDPGEGGTLVELDYKPRNLNLVNTLTRTKEEYHRQFIPRLFTGKERVSLANFIYQVLGSKERQIGRYLEYDRYRRTCLVEHFLKSDATVTRFSKGNCRELGDFVNRPYEYEQSKSAPGYGERQKGDTRAGNDGAETVSLERRGMVVFGRSKIPVRVTKTLTVEKEDPEIVIDYRITNNGLRTMKLRFAVEFNLSVKDSRFPGPDSMKGVHELEIKDEWHGVGINYRLGQKSEVWCFPVEAVSESEGGLEKTYQQLCLLFCWPLCLAAGKSWHVRIHKRLS